MTDRYMVDGFLRDAEEVRRIFRPGENDVSRLSIRQRVAARMIGRAGKRGRLLDVGCYAGTFLDAIGRFYPELDLTGVDAYPDNIRIARLLYPERASSFRCESVYALDLPDASFDCVTFLEVLEHVDRPVDAVRQLNRVIAPGGHLVLSTPNGVSARHVLQTIVRGYKDLVLSALGRSHRMSATVFFENVDWNRHLIEFSLTSLATLLGLNGFEIVEHRFVPTGDRYGIVDVVVPGLAGGQIVLARKVRSSPTTII